MTRILPTDGELVLAQFIWGKMYQLPADCVGPIAVEKLREQNVPLPKNLAVCFASDFLKTPWWEDKRQQ